MINTESKFSIKKLTDKILWIFIRIFVILFIIWFIWSQNNMVTVKKYIYSTSDLDKSFVGYSILHISDICNTNNNVIKAAKKTDPNIIVLTGGYSDEKGRYDNTVKIVNKLCEIAPVYYIYNTNDKGNELENTNATYIVGDRIELSPELVDLETFIKSNYGNKLIKQASKGNEESLEYIKYIKEELLNTQNSKIYLSGIDNYVGVNNTNKIKDNAYSLIGTDATILNIMLNGNIDNIDIICKTDVDMVIFGGTFGEKSIDKRYSKGTYGNNGTQLFVSGGCESKATQHRILNYPEIQYIVLSDGTIKKSNPLSDFLSLFINDVGTIYDNDDGFKEYTYTYEEIHNKDEANK